jgi:Mg/Co/Ni transporter MgtE
MGFGRTAYQRRSKTTSMVLGQLFDQLRGEGYAMSYTMEDFKRDVIKKQFRKLPLEEQREVFQSLPPGEREEVLRSLPLRERRELFQSLPLGDRQEVFQSLPVEERLAGLSPEQIQQYLTQLTAGRATGSRKPRRKK